MQKIHEGDCTKCGKALYRTPARMNWGGLPDPEESEAYFSDDEPFCEDCYDFEGECGGGRILEFPQQCREELSNVIFINEPELTPVA